MPRGRQYYDPILQVPGKVEVDQDLSRIELFPETLDAREETAQPGKWRARLIRANGSIAETSKGDFSRDRAQAEAERLWPGLVVHELRSEFEDSTWSGIGPSPRGWQSSSPEGVGAPPAVLGGGSSSDVAASEMTGDEPTAGSSDQIQLRLLPITEPGAYVLLEDVRMLLEAWAVQYEVEKNPSAAMALREAVDTLRGIG